MRYRIGEDPASGAWGSTDEMLLLTAVLGVVVGVVLTWLGWHGRQMWLKWWGGGLVVVSIVWLAWMVAFEL